MGVSGNSLNDLQQLGQQYTPLPPIKMVSLVLDNKNISWLVQGQTRTWNPWKRKQKPKTKNNNKHTWPLHGTRHDMNLKKDIQAQAKSTKETYYSYHNGVGHFKLMGAKKRSADGKVLNTFSTLEMAKDTKTNNKSK